MSDVERICSTNHERRKWAEEYMEVERAGILPPLSRKEKAITRRRQRCFRTAALACAMATGTGATFVGFGITALHMPTLIVGAIVTLGFLTVAIILEAAASASV